MENDFDNLTLHNENIFKFDFKKIIKEDYEEYLIVENPPWVTNTNLSKYESKNIPMKNNIKNYGQFEAKTGMSNFDVSENIIIHIIEKFRQLNTTIIFLCKYNVACNIFKYLVKTRVFPARVNIVKFNAMQIFGIDSSSCILIIQFNENNKEIKSCTVNNLNNPHEHYRIGIKNGKLYSNIDNDIDIDGKCCFEWRQGIKHDCVKVMELEKTGTKYKNKKEDLVELEEDLLYPLLKSSNVKIPIVKETGQKILVTQHKLKEDTSYIKEKYPLTWAYLEKNKEYFDKRKSSIYQKAPDYSIFGIGEYTFKKIQSRHFGFLQTGTLQFSIQ